MGVLSRSPPWGIAKRKSAKKDSKNRWSPSWERRTACGSSWMRLWRVSRYDTHAVRGAPPAEAASRVDTIFISQIESQLVGQCVLFVDEE